MNAVNSSRSRSVDVNLLLLQHFWPQCNTSHCPFYNMSVLYRAIFPLIYRWLVHSKMGFGKGTLQRGEMLLIVKPWLLAWHWCSRLLLLRAPVIYRISFPCFRLSPTPLLHLRTWHEKRSIGNVRSLWPFPNHGITTDVDGVWQMLTKLRHNSVCHTVEFNINVLILSVRCSPYGKKRKTS